MSVSARTRYVNRYRGSALKRAVDRIARDGYRVHRRSGGGVELLENDGYNPSKWFVRGPGGMQEFPDKAAAEKQFREVSEDYR